jgi:Ca-activated chloride channel family protein
VFNLVETAVLEGPELSIENGQLLQMQPSTLPDLAPGEELFVTARALGSGPVRIVLKGKGVRGPVESKAIVNLGTPNAKPWVGRVWARERVNHVLDDMSLLGETDERKNEVIELAVSYGFVTPYTSFLAIPESELTGTTSEMMRDMRAKKQAILAKRADAVALSRSEMPPGDPVLSVDAPADALRVTAYFPFGERELTYDAEARRWRVRFLVPVETQDGTYEVPVLVIHHDGHVEYLIGKYTIDSREPEFEPMIQCRKGIMEITVATHEPVREVRAALVIDSSHRVDLRVDRRDPSLTRYVGKLSVPQGARVRIVVADRARNEADEVVSCPAETTEERSNQRTATLEKAR